MHTQLEKQNYSLPFLIAVISLIAALFASADEPSSKPTPANQPQQQEVLNNATIIELKGLGLGESVIVDKIKTSTAELKPGVTNSVTIENRSPYRLDVYRNGKPWEDQKKESAGKIFHFPAEIVPNGMITFTNVATTERETLTVRVQVEEVNSIGCVVQSRVTAVCTRIITIGTHDAHSIIVVSTNDFSHELK
jgi:hypothetical protein